MKKINWFDHSVNLVVVIAGISIAFSLNTWNASRNREELRNTYVEAMKDELAADIADFDSLIIGDSIRELALNKLWKLNDEPLSEDSINWAMSLFTSDHSFETHNITFESLKSSGKFDVISDVKLRLEIMGYYHNSYNSIAIIEEYTKKSFDDYIIPFLMDEFNPEFGGSMELLKAKKFMSVLMIHMSFIQQRLEVYSKSRKRANQLYSALNAINYN